jgi:hypothetical protein
MPNWCHNTLTVSGEEAALAVFVEKVKTEEQPLSFAAIIPEPSEEVLRRDWERYKPCTMCGAVGTLPESEAQAAERGAKWYPWMDPAEREDRTCNVCAGTTLERVGMPGWHNWRCTAWGTKWDASFADSGPFLALGQEGMDVELSKSTQVATSTPTVAVYKFDTAWGPPAPVIEAASAQHPELEFTLRYGEPGEGFAGEVKYAEGICLVDEALEVEEVLAPEEMWF